MATFLLHSTPSPYLIKIHSSLKPDHIKAQTLKPIKAARDRIIDFGKHKGQMLGTLPSTYLKWVSKNLRAQDFQDWALLADQVLEDPVYNDRVEWEFADKLLNGDVLSSSSSLRSEKGAVQDLVEISERFGWDNDDKIGWSKVDFRLLGTSNSGRIPRIVDGRERELKSNSNSRREKVGEENGGEREKRRERLKMKRGGVGITDEKDSLGISGVHKGIGGNNFGDQEQDDRTVVDLYNPFPGRDSLLKKVLDKKRVM